MSTYVPGFQSFFFFLHYFILTKLAPSSIRVNTSTYISTIMGDSWTSRLGKSICVILGEPG